MIFISMFRAHLGYIYTLNSEVNMGLNVGSS